MAFSLLWLPEVLLEAGLKVATVPGWENRGHGDVGKIFGVLCHHTGTATAGVMPTLNVLIKGRSDLPGPLSQLGLGRDGTYFVIAAGKCSHAGRGEWKGKTAGNTNFIGIEAENSGSENYPAVQMDAYRRGAAAILRKVKQEAEFCAGHREYATPLGRKNDPKFDMDEFRLGVAAILAGTAPPPVLIPAVEPPPRPGDPPGRPTLRRGAEGEFVKQLQQKLGVEVVGHFGPRTEAAVRAFQREHKIVPDGIVGPKTWRALDKVKSV